MTRDGKLLRGLFEHERLKPAVIRMDKGNINTLSALKESWTWRYLPNSSNSPTSWRVHLQMLKEFNKHCIPYNKFF